MYKYTCINKYIQYCPSFEQMQVIFFFSIYSVFWGRHMKTASSDYPEPAEVSSTQAILTHAPHLFCLASTLFIHPLIP